MQQKPSPGCQPLKGGGRVPIPFTILSSHHHKYQLRLQYPSSSNAPLEALPILLRIKVAYTQDGPAVSLLQQLLKESTAAPSCDYTLEDGLLNFDGRILVTDDNSIQRDILSSCHVGLTAGHFGNTGPASGSPPSVLLPHAVSFNETRRFPQALWAVKVTTDS